MPGSAPLDPCPRSRNDPDVDMVGCGEAMIDLLERHTKQLNTAAEVVDAIDALVWPERAGDDRLGVEVEAFPVVVRDDEPAGRLELDSGDPSVLGLVDTTARTGRMILPRRPEVLRFETSAGGLVTFEPGAQIEHSTVPAHTTQDLQAELTSLWDEVEEVFGSEGVSLVSLGVDPWHTAESIPQQLPLPRYQAMDRYFASQWPAGAVMMRNTCAIQVNLDAGIGQVREERWLAANLLSPLLTAMFACSPGPGTRSRRARVWQELDETRVGLPRWASTEDAKPLGDCAARALAANVMFIIRSDGARPGRPGWSFRHWVEEGHSEVGRPTVADLENHLTTLFPEVRPRNGVMEMRAPDGLPSRWWIVPAVVAGSLLYDDRARSTILELLEPLVTDLNGVWHRAARDGISDPELGWLVRQVADLTAEAARRQPGRFGAPAVAVTEAFLERFTLRGRCPADELVELLPSPEKALVWAAGDPEMGGLS